MNLLLVLANVVGFLALAAACLKVLETGPAIGPAFSPAAKVVLLTMVFLSVWATIEVLSWRSPICPVAAALVLIMGLFSVWRVWSPFWASFFTRPPAWLHLHRDRVPHV